MSAFSQEASPVLMAGLTSIARVRRSKRSPGKGRQYRALAGGYRLMAWRHLRAGHNFEAEMYRRCSDEIRSLNR